MAVGQGSLPPAVATAIEQLELERTSRVIMPKITATIAVASIAALSLTACGGNTADYRDPGTVWDSGSDLELWAAGTPINVMCKAHGGAQPGYSFFGYVTCNDGVEMAYNNNGAGDTDGDFDGANGSDEAPVQSPP